MCFALPLKVVNLKKGKAAMEDGRLVNLSLVGTVKRGDWLMVQSDLAVDKLTGNEAKLMRSELRRITDELKV